MHLLRREFALLAAAWPLASVSATRFAAPNIVEITPTLVTSGQPSAKALAALAEEGFQAVIYLAPSSVSDAIANEPEILKAQGIGFDHIPIPFGEPTEVHFAQFAEQLTRLGGRKVLVHCQVNMRASTMVFLYRVIVGKESATIAYSSVTKVWSPQGPWLSLVKRLLAKYEVDFEPF